MRAVLLCEIALVPDPHSRWLETDVNFPGVGTWSQNYAHVSPGHVKAHLRHGTHGGAMHAALDAGGAWQFHAEAAFFGTEVLPTREGGRERGLREGGHQPAQHPQERRAPTGGWARKHR